MNRLIGITLMALLVAGCATFELNSYKTLRTTHTLVDGAMNGWGEWVRAGKASAPDEVMVRAMYEEYQQTMKVAEKAVESLRETGDKGEIERVLIALERSSDDLIVLIQYLKRHE